MSVGGDRVGFRVRQLQTQRLIGLIASGGGNVAMRTFTAVLRGEGELHVAECPEAGTVSQGVSIEEAIANLREATELYLEEFPLLASGWSLVTTFEADYSRDARSSGADRCHR
jgi:predicted RNase H-like HicB family nuclease